MNDPEQQPEAEKETVIEIDYAHDGHDLKWAAEEERKRIAAGLPPPPLFPWKTDPTTPPPHLQQSSATKNAAVHTSAGEASPE